MHFNLVCTARGLEISKLYSKLNKLNLENEEQAKTYKSLLGEYRGILCNSDTYMYV